MRSAMRASSAWVRAFQPRSSGAIRSVSCSPSKIMRCEDGVDEGLQGVGRQAVLCGDGGEFLGVLLGLEAAVAVADGGLAEALARLERADVGGDLLALVHELGVGLDEADELLAAHLRACPASLAENLAISLMM